MAAFAINLVLLLLVTTLGEGWPGWAVSNFVRRGYCFVVPSFLAFAEQPGPCLPSHHLCLTPTPPHTHHSICHRFMGSCNNKNANRNTDTTVKQNCSLSPTHILPFLALCRGSQCLIFQNSFLSSVSPCPNMTQMPCPSAKNAQLLGIRGEDGYST